jgi:hypothetical protein
MYALSNYEFTPYPGQTLSNDADPAFALFGAKAQYKLTIDASGADDFDDRSFYFNPALFKQLSIPAPDPVAGLKGFFGNTNGKAFDGGVVSYPLSIIAGTNPEQVKNFDASWTYVTLTQIVITFNFYFIYDIEDFITGTTQENLKKFTYSKKAGGAAFTNVSPSVYNEHRAMWFYFYIYKNTDFAAKSYFYAKPGDIMARFYGVGDANAAPDHPLTAPLELKVGGGNVTGLAINYDTEVTWKFSGGAAAPDKAYAILYRTDGVDNTINYKDAVIKGYGEILTDVGVTTINGALKNPAEKSFAAGESTLKFNINYTQVVLGGTYRIAILIYHNSGLYTTHISNELVTFAAPPAPIYPSLVTDGFIDYTNDVVGGNVPWGPNLMVALQERIKSFARFDKAAYDAEIVSRWGTGSYDSQISNVEIRISDAATFEVLYSRDLTNGVTIFSPSPTEVEYSNEFRIRHDEVKSWEGRNLIVKWIQTFSYPKTLTGLPEDHSGTVVLKQFLYVKEYDNGRFTDIGTNDFFLSKGNGDPDDRETQSPEALSNLCGQDYIAAYFFRYYALDCKVLAYIDQRFYGADSIKEEETFAGELAQKLNDTLFNVPVGFPPEVGGYSFFHIDVSKLIKGVQYRASVTLKYIEEFPPEA